MCLNLAGLRALGPFLILGALFWAVSAKQITNFVSKNVLPDGEVETRVYFNKIAAKETSVSKSSGEDIRFRQLTDGRHFIQLIYANNTITDCEFIRDRKQVKSFLKQFRNELSQLVSTSNITVDNLDNKTLPNDVEKWFNYTKLRDLCKQNHRKLKKAALNMKRRAKNRMMKNATTTTEAPTTKKPRQVKNARRLRQPDDKMRTARSSGNDTSLMSEFFIMPGTLWCGPHDKAGRYGNLGGLSKTDICCRRHDQCKFNIHSYSIKYGYNNMSPFTISHCSCDSRNSRDVTDVLRVPGTKWCGKGYSATKYTHIGEFSRTDRCCRVHDLACPFYIPGFATKWGLFNWRVNTIMHCSCDERFRACLKLVDTSDANFVGKLFFNVVQTKCFVIKPKKVCIKHSWWGDKCEEYTYTKQAVLRDNVPY